MKRPEPKTPMVFLRDFLTLCEHRTDYDVWESEAWRVRWNPASESWYITRLVEPKTNQYMTKKQAIATIGGSASGRAINSRDWPNVRF